MAHGGFRKNEFSGRYASSDPRKLPMGKFKTFWEKGDEKMFETGVVEFWDGEWGAVRTDGGERLRFSGLGFQSGAFPIGGRTLKVGERVSFTRAFKFAQRVAQFVEPDPMIMSSYHANVLMALSLGFPTRLIRRLGGDKLDLQVVYSGDLLIGVERGDGIFYNGPLTLGMTTRNVEAKLLEWEKKREQNK